MGLKDAITYKYIREIKKGFLCPNCRKDDVLIDSEKKYFNCRNCNCKIEVTAYEQGMEFWFCDQCDAFLNNQKNFEETEDKIWICTECGCLNDISGCNIFGQCRCCMILIDDPNKTICKDCEKIQLEKWKARMDTVNLIISQSLDAIDCLSNIDGDIKKLKSK